VLQSHANRQVWDPFFKKSLTWKHHRIWNQLPCWFPFPYVSNMSQSRHKGRAGKDAEHQDSSGQGWVSESAEGLVLGCGLPNSCSRAAPTIHRYMRTRRACWVCLEVGVPGARLGAWGLDSPGLQQMWRCLVMVPTAMSNRKLIRSIQEAQWDFLKGRAALHSPH
jgi:hypothetical protein